MDTDRTNDEARRPARRGIAIAALTALLVLSATGSLAWARSATIDGVIKSEAMDSAGYLVLTLTDGHRLSVPANVVPGMLGRRASWDLTVGKPIRATYRLEGDRPVVTAIQVDEPWISQPV